MFFVSVFSATTVSNLTVSPTSPNAGDAITITFTIQTGISGECTEFAIGYSPDSSLPACKVEWFMTRQGIYHRSTSSTYWWIDGVSVTAGGNDNMYSRMLDDWTSSRYYGVTNSALCDTSPHNISVITNIPPEQTGTRYVFVAGIDKGSTGGQLTYDCESGTPGSPSIKSVTITASGTAQCYKLNMTVCRWIYGDSTDNTYWRYHYIIRNWSESGVPLNDIAVRYYFYSTNNDWQNGFAPGGFRYDELDTPLDTLNQAATSTYNTMGSTSDCGSGRTANKYYSATYSSTRPLPGGGGYYSTWNQDPAQYYRSGNPDIVTTGLNDDFMRVTDMTSCTNLSGTKVTITSITDNEPYISLLYKSTPVCEYTSKTTSDSSSGTIPCETPCSGNTYCPATTPTPAIALTKTIDKTVATIGDTISYCIIYTNNASYTITTLNIWDTIPAVTDFITGTAGFSTTGFTAPVVVSWTLSSVAPSASATYCFTVRVARYPYNMLEQMHMLGVIDEKEFDYLIKRLKEIEQAAIYQDPVARYIDPGGG